MKREHATLIIPRLWLGNKIAALDDDFLLDNNITVIFNATKDIPFTKLPVNKYRVPVDDNLQASEIKNMTDWSPEIVYKVLNEYNKGKTILIHCYAGMQRSAAIMAMVLIILRRKSAEEAIDFIRDRRSIAFFPQANFGRSIVTFEKHLQYELGERRR